MVMPTPPTQERTSLDQNQKQIAKALLTLVENLIAFSQFVNGIPSGGEGVPDSLTQPPYNYDADQAYALRLWGQHGEAYAHIFENGGTLSAGDSTTFEQLTRRSAGVIVFQPSGF